MLRIRDGELFIDVEGESEGDIFDELRHDLADRWKALVDTPPATLSESQRQARDKLVSIFEVEVMDNNNE